MLKWANHFMVFGKEVSDRDVMLAQQSLIDKTLT